MFHPFPHGRVSDVQRRQMTTVEAENIHTIALEGTFDDAQACIKNMFNHKVLRDELNLCGVNSINFARVLFQTVYYFTSAAVLAARIGTFLCRPNRQFRRYFRRLDCQTLRPSGRPPGDRDEFQRFLARTLASGHYAVQTVQATQSPSMDIQVSSNFERLLFEAHGRDAATLRRLMAGLRQSQGFSIEPGPLQAIRAEFDAVSVTRPKPRKKSPKLARSGYLATRTPPSA